MGQTELGLHPGSSTDPLCDLGKSLLCTSVSSSGRWEIITPTPQVTCLKLDAMRRQRHSKFSARNELHWGPYKRPPHPNTLISQIEKVQLRERQPPGHQHRIHEPAFPLPATELPGLSRVGPYLVPCACGILSVSWSQRIIYSHISCLGPQLTPWSSHRPLGPLPPPPLPLPPTSG